MMSVGLSYGEDGSVKMAESASLVHGNLAVLQGLEEGGLAYGLVSRNVAAITYASSTGAIASESVGFPGSQEDVSSRTLTGMEWCRLKSSRVVLVLTSYRGFRISNWNGQEVAYENIFETGRGAYEQRFARGIATVDNVVCVGTSEGNITVLYVPPTGCDVVFSRHLQGHSAPITALCPCTLNQVASSDESGMIIVWSNPVISAESRFVINEPGSFPCQCLCHWRGILVAGFSSGTIRLYNTETGRKTAEIAAHGRSVTALDTAQDSGLVSTEPL
ncbi:WD repeat-containing protein 54 [Geodia barretti]|uniref:WD repeat-containing protein 54 n=1 Tax=Geodia barretti TaxID=519541 RepID=A0AA35RM13_GEOBA|nr:WD repeat-containing protein 54 [Geodia barretti]